MFCFVIASISELVDLQCFSVTQICMWNCKEYMLIIYFFHNCPPPFFLLVEFDRVLRVWGTHYQTPLKIKAVGSCCHGLNPYNVWVRLHSALNYSALFLQALLSACCLVKPDTPKHERRTCKQSLGVLDHLDLFFSLVWTLKIIVAMPS